MKRLLSISPNGEICAVFSNDQISLYENSKLITDNDNDKYIYKTKDTHAPTVDFCVDDKYIFTLDVSNSPHYDFITLSRRLNLTKGKSHYFQNFHYNLKEKNVCSFLLKNGKQICVMTPTGIKIFDYEKEVGDIKIDYILKNDIKYKDLGIEYDQNIHRISFSDNGKQFCIKNTQTQSIHLFEVGNNECVKKWIVPKNTLHKISNRRGTMYFGSQGSTVRAENEFMNTTFFERSESEKLKNSPVKITESPDGSLVALSWINFNTQNIETNIFETLSYSCISIVISDLKYSDWNKFRVTFIKESDIYSVLGIVSSTAELEKHKFVVVPPLSKTRDSLLKSFLESSNDSCSIKDYVWSLTHSEKICLSEATLDLKMDKAVNLKTYFDNFSLSKKTELFGEIFDINISELNTWADPNSSPSIIRNCFVDVCLELTSNEICAKNICNELMTNFEFVNDEFEFNKIFSNMARLVESAKNSISLREENIRFYRSCLSPSEKKSVRKIVAKNIFNKIGCVGNESVEKDIYNALRKWDGLDIIKCLENENYDIEDVEEIQLLNNAHLQIKSAYKELSMSIDLKNKSVIGEGHPVMGATANQNSINMNGGLYVHSAASALDYVVTITGTAAPGTAPPDVKGSVSDLIPDPYLDKNYAAVLNPIFHNLKNMDHVYGVASTKDKKYVVVAGKKKVSDGNDFHSKLPYDLRKQNYDLSAIHKISIFKKEGNNYKHVVDLHHHNFLYDKIQEAYDETTQLMGCNINIASAQDSEDLVIETVYKTHTSESVSTISNIHLPNTSQLTDYVINSGVFKDSLWLETAVQMLSPKKENTKTQQSQKNSDSMSFSEKEQHAKAIHKMTLHFQEFLRKNPATTDKRVFFQKVCKIYNLSIKDQVLFCGHLISLGYAVENIPAEKLDLTKISPVSLKDSVKDSVVEKASVAMAMTGKVVTVPYIISKAANEFIEFVNSKERMGSPYSFFRSLCGKYNFTLSEETQLVIYLEEIVPEVSLKRPEDDLFFLKQHSDKLDAPNAEDAEKQEITKPELSMFQQAAVKSFVDVVSDQFLDIIKNYYPAYSELFEVPYFIGIIKLSIAPIIESLGIEKINSNQFVQEAFHVLKKEGLTDISLEAIDYVEKQFRTLLNSQKVPVLAHVFKTQETKTEV